jgi:hypothetical protein
MAPSIYKEGTFIDLWSIPHFLAGVIIGLPLLQHGVGFWTAGAIVLILCTMFEIVELAFDIHESMANRITDVVLPMIAYPAAYYSFITRDPDINNALLVFSSVLYILIIIPGWLLYQKRKREEAR